MLRQLFESSTRDPLTGAYNKKYIGERLVAEVAHGGQPDGAFFPGVADSSGHGNALSSWTEADFAGAFEKVKPGDTALARYAEWAEQFGE